VKETTSDAGRAADLSGHAAGIAGRVRGWWSAALGAIGTLVGLAPHLLHHIGFLAGTALIAGIGGTAVFGIVGLAASIPLLLRLRRRFGTWWAPAIGLAVFAVMFSVSAFGIGPAISGADSGPVPGGDQPSPPPEHTEHHD
jgi:hypothetical protein